MLFAASALTQLEPVVAFTAAVRGRGVESARSGWLRTCSRRLHFVFFCCISVLQDELSGDHRSSRSQGIPRAEGRYSNPLEE